MAPSGQKLGKLVLPACQHGPTAKAFLGSHLCWQDRIATERNAAYQVSSVKPLKEPASQPPQKSQSMTCLQMARSEYHPIGGNSKHNNNSGQISATLGPKSWHASGGMKSEYRSQSGFTNLTMFGSPPVKAAPDMSASYLPNQIRAEGRRKGRADQVEAIRQYGEGTILMKSKGEAPALSPAEEQVFRDSRGDSRGRSALVSGGQGRAISTGASCRSRLSEESWGSAQSNPASELRRIAELGNKARAIGQQGASSHHAEPVRQLGEDTILALSRQQQGM